MQTDFTVTGDGMDQDYRLAADALPSPETLMALAAAAGLPPSALREVPAPGAVVGLEPGPSARAPRGAELRVVSGPDAGVVVPLESTVTTVGRDPRCSLTLSDPDVAWRHLEIEVTVRRITLLLLTTPPPTRLDGTSIDSSATALVAGDQLRIANTVLALVDPTLEAGTGAGALPTTIEFPAAPTNHGPSLGLAAAAASVLAGGVAALVTRSAELLVLAVIPPLCILAASLGGRAKHRRAGRRAARAYRQETARAAEALRRTLAAERVAAHRAHPDPATLATAPADRAGTGFRVGLGRSPATVAVHRQGRAPDHPSLQDVPIVAALDHGPLAFCGPLPLARAQARWAVCQLAGNPELEWEFWLSPEAEPEWTWARWLPQLVDVHVGATLPGHSPRRNSRVVVVDHPLAATAAHLPQALLVSGSARAPSAARQATVPCDDTGLRQVLTGSDHEPIAFSADLVSVEFADRFARRLASLGRRSAPGATIPDEVRLADLLDGGRVAPRVDAAAIADAWRGDPSSLRTPIGVGPDGTVVLDFDRDGPHGLVAGTTGSGKSELLQAIVIGLATRYRPEAVQFLLVDYKGGSAFAACADLPHTSGVVTDLDAQRTRRALRSLRAELRRRESVLASAGARDFATLHREGRRADVPRLVVVVDEFAALSVELPEFVAGLVDIAQRGRSLGMHLVLATQRPAGVVSPEIRANAALRIALRTISAAESLDVIDRPDAADLDASRPGRALIGGRDSAVQLAAVSGPTHDVLRAPTLTPLGPWRRAPHEPDTERPAGPTDADRLVHTVSEASRLCGATVPAAPWLPPLPKLLAAGDVTAPSRRCVAIGLVDLPDEQRQAPLLLDLESGGAVGLAGGPRSGRSTALRTIACAAIATRTPEELHLHVVDLAGGVLDELGGAPHIGTRLDTRAGPGTLAAFAAHLERAIERRRSSGTSSPAVLVLLDTWTALASATDAADLGVTTERLRRLLARCRGTGVTVVVTGDRELLHPQTGSVLDERFVLAPADPAEYAAVGLTAVSMPEDLPPGRGVRLPDGAEVHFALPPRLPVSEPGVAEVAASAVSGRILVRPLPDIARARYRPTDGDRICLGLGGDAAEPVWLDLDQAPSLLVAGPRRSGRTTVLAGILEQAVRTGRSVTVVAPPASPLRPLARSAGQALVDDACDVAGDHGLVLVDDAEELDPAVSERLAALIRQERSAVIVVSRADAALTSFRGPVAELRRLGHGIVLQPAALDGELINQRLSRADLGGPPGRAVAAGDPAWGWPVSLAHPGWIGLQTWAPSE